MDRYQELVERVVRRMKPKDEGEVSQKPVQSAIDVSKVSAPAQRLKVQTADGSPDDISRLSEEQMRDIAALIDHTLLKPEAAAKDIKRLCSEADRFGFASAVAQPCWIKLIKQTLKNPAVRVCGIAGFPLGGHSTAVKAAETAGCVEDGADEVDMVINIGWAKMGEWKAVEEEIAAVVEAAKGAAVKVIIECCLLTDEEKVKACLCAVQSGAKWVKSSTGFSKWGAKVSDIALMRRVVGPDFGVKASGGIRDLAAVLEMIKAGADRIGASSGATIMGQNPGVKP